MAITSPPPTPVSTSRGRPDGAQHLPTIREKALNIAVWTLFSALWVAFLATLLTSPGTPGDLWPQICEVPLIYQGALWLLFLPVIAGPAIWDTTRSPVVRVILIGGIAGFNLHLFFPRNGGTK